MKKISLAPYPGYVVITRDKKEFARMYPRMFPGDDVPTPGWGMTCFREGQCEFLVYSNGRADTLVHELGHVVLALFKCIRSDPTEGGGEPFCYLIGHLMAEARKR